jgi:hypothetical protein
MGGNKSKRPEPSHKTGKLRDKRIEKMMDPEYRAEHLHALIKKAATTPKKR